MPGLGLDNSISNIIGKELPQWVLNQLETRANQNSKDSRDNDNILYLANKTAWVKLVSSINIESQSDLNYFKGIVGDTIIQKPFDLAKNFVLFGGTSKYLGSNSYGLRSGLGKDGAYGMLGTKEIQEYGYRPMPGITSANIETQGRLGSIRGAVINFKCWDKNQLDIMDTLYFKLGFTMFLEWGHTFFYPSPANKMYRKEVLDPNTIHSTELYSIDPFEENLTKEEIGIKIAKNSRETEGNYDAMLGMVTNFNFSYNEEGGFDCTLRLMALGILGDSIKINNSGVLPSLLQEEILRYNKTITRITAAIAAAQAAANAAANATTTTGPPPKIEKIKADDFFNKYIKPNTDPALNVAKSTAVQTYAPGGGYAISNTGARTGLNAKYTGGNISLSGRIGESYKTIDAVFNSAEYGEVYFIRQQKGFIPIDSRYIGSTKIGLDAARFYGLLSQLSKWKDQKKWTFPSNWGDKLVLLYENPGSTFSNLLSAGLGIITGGTLGIGNNLDQVSYITDTAFTDLPYSNKNNNLLNNIKIERHLSAVSNNKNLKNYFSDGYTEGQFGEGSYQKVSGIEYEKALAEALQNPAATFPVLKVFSNPNDGTTTTTIGVDLKFIRNVELKTGGKTDAEFILHSEISFTDSSLIGGIIVPDTIVEPIEFVAQKNLVAQNQTQTATPAADTSKEDTKKIQENTEAQIKQAINLQSALEIALRTIQVHALNQAIETTGNDLEIGRKLYNLKLLDDKQYKFTAQVFSNGIFSPFLKDLVYGNISDGNYLELNGTKKIELDERLKVYSKYGFATSLLANKATIDTLEPNNYKQLLNAYVVPYQINQELVKGVATNHPVYIPLGLLLMIINHSCTIYDTKSKKGDLQTPLVYVDFNTELNFCLSNTKQLSTNPWITLIPFEGSNTDYTSLFDPNILNNKKTEILPVSGSKDGTKLYTPESQDLLSGALPKIKFDDSTSSNMKATSNVYRAKVMNILLNIDYLVKLVEQYSLKDGSNSVYLKTFLEQVLSDLNKYLGDFNKFRLAYNDAANTFQIVDDQFLPALEGENQVSPNSVDINRNGLPLYGKRSIAKSLEIKTEISSKLSNMIAISANSNTSNKATLSNNGDPVGFINSAYVDRYVQDRTEVTGSSRNKIDLDTIKTAAAQFNQTITDFYSKINPSENSVGQATNYYIEKMSKIKNDEYATRASPMIPVSVNFSTDGISGMHMGHAFTIPDELLPYTYSRRNSQRNLGTKTNSINKVGFVMIGLTHHIENNVWNTDVKANMIFLKEKNDFKGDVQKVEAKNEAFGTDPNNFENLGGSGFGGVYSGGTLTAGSITTGKITKTPLSFLEIVKFIVANLEGGYFHPDMITRGDIKDPQGLYRSSEETMMGMDRNPKNSVNNSIGGKKFWAIVDNNNFRTGLKNEGLPAEPLLSQLFDAEVEAMQPEFERLFKTFIPDANLRALIQSDGRLYYNFVYATWNGSGWFQQYGNYVSKAYANGQKNPDELLKIAINLRLNSRLFWPDVKDYAYKLMNRGGTKIAKHVGVELTGPNTTG
jgi:hypothetical protein